MLVWAVHHGDHAGDKNQLIRCMQIVLSTGQALRVSQDAFRATSEVKSFLVFPEETFFSGQVNSQN